MHMRISVRVHPSIHHPRFDIYGLDKAAQQDDEGIKRAAVKGMGYRRAGAVTLCY